MVAGGRCGVARQPSGRVVRLHRDLALRYREPLSSFNQYFKDELAYLRELGREFSQAYPMLAPMLADRGGDPDVERLLEGVAFLTGRLRQKLDDELPEIVVGVATLLFPHLLRPLPACSILEFSPLMTGARDRTVVPAFAEFSSVDVNGVACRFRSTTATEISPVAIADVRLESIPHGKQELKLSLDAAVGVPPRDSLPESLRLHFPGEGYEALRLWSWVLERTDDVLLRAVGPDGRIRGEVSLGKRSLKVRSFDADQSLLPMGSSTFHGFRLLEEYYVLPEKFAFVDIDGVREAAGALGMESPHGLVLALRFDRRLVDAAPVTKDSVKLHCVPIVNVFQTSAEPVRLAVGRERFRVKPTGLSVRAGEVYSIERVTTILRHSGKRVELPCFYDFSHSGAADSSGIFYTPHYAPSVVGDGVDLTVSFGSASQANLLPDADVASLDLLATNRSHANALRAGEIRVATGTSPIGVSFRNLFAVRPHVSPPFGRELHWRVVAHAAMGIRALTELDVLRSVLDVYNLHAIVDRQAARAGELRMAALKDIRLTPSERLLRGVPVRGIDIEVDAEETGFQGDGDLYLFGSVLERFFGHYVSLNSFSRMTLSGLTTKQKYVWPARSGSVTLL